MAAAVGRLVVVPVVVAVAAAEEAEEGVRAVGGPALVGLLEEKDAAVDAVADANLFA